MNSLRLAATRFSAGDPVLGNAFADLSVTGRRSFAAFRQALPGEAFCQSLGGPNIQNGCRTALDRAYRVANFLRTGQRGDTPALKAAKVAERNALGWIAVSGEDDSPHRPVNVPSSDFPQYDLLVLVPTPLSGASPVLPVRTRYTIAQSQTPGNNLVVIGMDLPTSGYADNLDYNLVSRLEFIGAPRRLPLTNDPYDFAASGATPLLDFIEAFIVVFADMLDRSVPIKNNIKAVMGGSLGGNMTFRLGRRPNVPWLPRFLVAGVDLGLSRRRQRPDQASRSAPWMAESEPGNDRAWCRGPRCVLRNLGSTDRQGRHPDGSVRYLDERLLSLQEVGGRGCPAGSAGDLRSALSGLALATRCGAAALQSSESGRQ